MWCYKHVLTIFLMVLLILHKCSGDFTLESSMNDPRNLSYLPIDHHNGNHSENIMQYSTVNSHYVVGKSLNRTIQFCEKLHNNTWKGIKNRRIDTPIEPTYYFKQIKFPQLVNYQQTYAGNNVAKIVDFFRTNGHSVHRSGSGGETVNGRVRISGVYTRKYPRKDSVGSMNKIEQNVLPAPFKPSVNGHAYNANPTAYYKPPRPGDVNLLAVKNFRFSPNAGVKYYKNAMAINRLHDTYRNRGGVIPKEVKFTENFPHSINMLAVNNQMLQLEKEMVGNNTRTNGSIGRKSQHRKYPFSVMLDLYPMNDVTEDVMEIPNDVQEEDSPPYQMVHALPTYPHYQFNLPQHHHNPQYHSNMMYYPPYYQQHPAYIPHNNYMYKSNDGRSQSSGMEKPIHTKNDVTHKAENNPIQMQIFLNVYPKRKNIVYY